MITIVINDSSDHHLLGLYYKHIMIINYDCKDRKLCPCDSRLMLQIVASLILVM